MEIFINNEKTDFELENEKNSLDIINELSNFAAQSRPQQFITKIIINEKEHSFAEELKMKKILIDDINKVEIETSDIYGITYLSLDQIENFLNVLTNIFQNQNMDGSIAKVIDSINWMKQGINQIIRIFGSKDKILIEEERKFISNCDDLYKKVKNFGSSSIKISKNDINKILDYINKMSQSISIIREFLIKSYKLPNKDFILKNISELISNIDEILPALENIPVMFQTGEDKESMDIIKKLADILDKSISLFVVFKESLKLHMDKYTVKKVTFEEFFKTITDHLRELMEAIQNNDSVMISDLLEYEFVPNIEEIKNILVKIKDEAFNKIN